MTSVPVSTSIPCSWKQELLLNYILI
jgi:hypothetical protein